MIFDEEERKKTAKLIEEARVQCHATPDSENRPKVLCIESDPMTLMLCNDMLMEAGYQVIPAFDGDEGLFLATSIHPQIIIIDILMQGLDGWEILHRIKANPSTCDIPVIIAGAVEEKRPSLYLGASNYVAKPIDKARLLDALSCILSRSGKGECIVAIVDDDPSVLMIAAEVLEKEGGCRVCTYESGEAFLESLRKQRPDVVILDLLMPNIDGFQVLDALRANPDWATIPVMVITAKVLSTEELAWLNDRVRAVIRKCGTPNINIMEQLAEQIKLMNNREPAHENSSAG